MAGYRGHFFVTLGLGIAYLMKVPRSYTASFNILAFSDSLTDVYTELHEAKVIAADKQSLLTLFAEDLKTESGNGVWLFIAAVTPTQALVQLTQTIVDAIELAN